MRFNSAKGNAVLFWSTGRAAWKSRAPRKSPSTGIAGNLQRIPTGYCSLERPEAAFWCLGNATIAIYDSLLAVEKNKTCENVSKFNSCLPRSRATVHPHERVRLRRLSSFICFSVALENAADCRATFTCEIVIYNVLHNRIDLICSGIPMTKWPAEAGTPVTFSECRMKSQRWAKKRSWNFDLWQSSSRKWRKYEKKNIFIFVFWICFSYFVCSSSAK